MWLGLVFVFIGLMMAGMYYMDGDTSLSAQRQSLSSGLAENMMMFHYQGAIRAVKNNMTVLNTPTASVALAAPGVSTNRATGTLGASIQALLPSWYIASAPWQVAVGRDPATGSNDLVATYLPPNNTSNIDPSGIAVALASITGQTVSVGMVKKSGTKYIVVAQIPSMTTQMVNAAQSVPCDASGSPLVPEGSAVAVFDLTK